MIQLKLVRDTYLKKQTLDASELEELDKIQSVAGATYELSSWAEVENHLFVELKNTKLRDRSTWFVWSPDAEILKDGQPLTLVSDTKTYEFMQRLEVLTKAISDVQEFLSELMKPKTKP